MSELDPNNPEDADMIAQEEARRQEVERLAQAQQQQQNQRQNKQVYVPKPIAGFTYVHQEQRRPVSSNSQLGRPNKSN